MPLIATLYVAFAAPVLYMMATTLPSGFLNAIASVLPLVATTLAVGLTYCETWRKTW